MQFQTLININEPATSVLSISRSVGQKVHFLDRPVDDFEASDDDPMIRRLILDVDEDRRISCSKNQILEKSQGPINSKREKDPKNGPLGEKPATWCSMVAGDHGFLPHGRPPSSRFFYLVFRRFSLLFSSVFFLTFFLKYLAEFP